MSGKDALLMKIAAALWPPIAIKAAKEAELRLLEDDISFVRNLRKNLGSKTTTVEKTLEAIKVAMKSRMAEAFFEDPKNLTPLSQESPTDAAAWVERLFVTIASRF